MTVIISIILLSIKILFVNSYTDLAYVKSSPDPNAISAFSNMTNLCNCDMTDNFCDLYCCCDDDCLKYNRTLASWTNSGMCKTNKLSSTQIYFDLCLNNPNSYSLSDINTPVRLITQGLKTGLCVYINNSPKNMSNYIIKNVSNLQEFSNMLYENFGMNDTIINMGNYFRIFPFFKFTIPKYYNLMNLNTSSLNLLETKYIFNYKSYDPINIVYPTLKKVSTISIPILLPFGNCDFSDYVRFLRNQDITCGRKFVMNKEYCLNFNDILNYDSATYMNIFNISTIIYPSFRIFLVVNNSITEVNNTLAKTIYIDSNLTNANTYLCNNTIRNVEYNFDVTNNTLNGLEVKYYMQNLKMTINDTTYISTNYKVNFIKNNSVNSMKSGNPGYLKGKPILSGWSGSFQSYDNNTGTNKTYLYINQYKRPRLFTGIDNDGACIYSSNLYNLTNPTTESNPNISVNYDYNYVLDNQLTFEDKIQYGCYESLNLTELQTYCQNNLWMNKYFFKQLNNLSYFSQFGNPNASYISDWIKIQKINFLSFSSSWDTNFFKCSVPAIFSIDITLADFGTITNPQSSIVYVTQRLNYVYIVNLISDWFANVAGTDVRTKYYSYVEINFWKIKQSTTLWYAPHPPIFPKLPKNLMAPFKIGTTTYGSSSFIRSNFSLYLIMIIFFLSL